MKASKIAQNLCFIKMCETAHAIGLHPLLKLTHRLMTKVWKSSGHRIVVTEV